MAATATIVSLAAGADDRLFGGRGQDHFLAATTTTVSLGGGGDDRLFGGDGGDRLRGRAGDDLLSGGKGADRFIFSFDFGRDRLTDFDANPAGGQDLIDLRAFEFSGADFSRRVRVEDLGDDTLITVRGEGQILLGSVSGERADTVDETDFLL